MKLVLDMNLPPRLAIQTGSAGHEASHWSDVGAAEASDSEILAYAARAGAVVVTHDLDFGTILAASGEASPSVVIIRSDNLAVDAIASAVLSALVQFENELSLGALLIVDPRRTRVRLLPLQPQ